MPEVERPKSCNAYTVPSQFGGNYRLKDYGNGVVSVICPFREPADLETELRRSAELAIVTENARGDSFKRTISDTKQQHKERSKLGHAKQSDEASSAHAKLFAYRDANPPKRDKRGYLPKAWPIDAACYMLEQHGIEYTPDYIRKLINKSCS